MQNNNHIEELLQTWTNHPHIAPGDVEDKSSWGGLATAGFFGLFLPGLLGGLLYLGVPTAQVWDLDSASSFWNQDVNYIIIVCQSQKRAQALFAGASLVTTYLVADRSNPSATVVTITFLSLPLFQISINDLLKRALVLTRFCSRSNWTR